MTGRTLGPYRLDRELGAGGMGKVWAARVEGRVAGLATGTVVALKVVHPHLLETPGFFKRFLREAEMGKAVVHENVVRTFDCDAVSVGGVPHHFLVMEYVEGQTLRGLLAELERVPEELCRHIGREVAKGLAAIHAAGVVHRDMKPENVIISRCTAPGHDYVAERSTAQPRRSEGHVPHRCDHAVKVMDLGVARLQDEALRLSQTGVFVGSLHYAAPECFEGGGRNIDGRADLHALGLVLYELACGVNPYFADDVPQTLERVLHGTPRRLGDVNPQLSPFLEEVVHTLLAKKPGERFADATALVAVLEDGEKSAWWKSRAKAMRAQTHRPLRRIRIPRETAMYGRDADLAKLRGLFEQVKAGDGRVVLVEGEAGIGKSRVVDELIGRLQRDGEDIDFLFGSYPPGGAATAAGAFSTAFREQFGDAGSAEHLVQTPILVPAFDALLRGETTPVGSEPLTKDSLQTCFVHATRSLAAERTTILLIDDLHFAPDEGRALFAALAMAVPGHRVLLVGTTRPGVDEKWLAQLTRLPQVSEVPLARLGPKDLVRLLADTLRSDQVAAELSAQIALKSDGNPFFVFEILRGLRDGQFLTRRHDGTWATTRVIDEIRIPSSVLDLVNARVADLGEDERALLDVAACWGFEFDPVLVGEAIGLARIPALTRFGRIERRHRLVCSTGRNCVFDHHQVQEALYGSLNEQLREEYHAALASALEARTGAAGSDPETLDGALCTDLCEHFLRGSAPGRAKRYLAAAQTYIEKGYLNTQAVALAERALAVPRLLTGAERAKALLRVCGTNGPLDRLGRRAQQEEALREAERLAEGAGDDELRGQAVQALGVLFAQTSRHTEAEASFRRALAIAESRGDRRTVNAAIANLGGVFWLQGRFAAAREHFERSLESSHELGDRPAEARATGNLGIVLAALGLRAEARARYERSLAMEREFGNRRGEANDTGSLGSLLRSEGRLAGAREHYERWLAISREIGARQGEANALGNLGLVFQGEGRRAAAREHYERSLAISREIGSRRSEAAALHNLGAAFHEEGESAAARENLSAALAIREETGDRSGAAATHLALGWLHLEAGDETLARAFFTKARDAASDAGAAGTETLARCRLACLSGGDAQDAERCFTGTEERLEAEERLESRWLLWKATGDRSHIAQAKRLLDEALALAPAEHHAAMLANVRVNREIATAAKAAGL